MYVLFLFIFIVGLQKSNGNIATARDMCITCTCAELSVFCTELPPIVSFADTVYKTEKYNLYLNIDFSISNILILQYIKPKLLIMFTTINGLPSSTTSANLPTSIQQDDITQVPSGQGLQSTSEAISNYKPTVSTVLK